MGISNIPVSTVPAVKRYLFDSFTDNLNSTVGHQLTVCYDAPGTYRPDDIVAVGAVIDRRATPWRMVGSGEKHWLKEDYELELVIDVYRGGDTRSQIDAYERAWALLGHMEQLVRVDPSLGGLVIQANPSGARDSSAWEKEHKGWLVSIEARVMISAAI